MRRDKRREEDIFVADDVLMAKEEEESMLKTYLDRKGLELNVGKTKVFREKGKRMN